MALFGVVSGSDIKTAGYNAAVGLLVAGSCFAVAFGVKKFAMWAFAYRVKTPQDEQKKSAEDWSSRAALVLGLAASYAASVYLPGSRFALISTSTWREAFKLGAMQAAAGYFTDAMGWKGQLKGDNVTFTTLGAGVALASRYSSINVLGFGAYGVLGAFGALLGAGYKSI